MSNTSSVALLVWRLATRDEPPSDSDPKQWQWPLDVCGAWWKGWFRQAKAV